MRKENKKKKWSKPKLLILTRDKPEERVLANCKLAGFIAGPGSHQQSTCLAADIGCNACSGFLGSS